MKELLTRILIALKARNVKIPKRLSMLNIPEASLSGALVLSADVDGL